MKLILPEYLKQGEPARLFPVLSNTSKEGRTTSIILACIAKIDEFGAELLGSLGQKVGKTAKVEAFTEVVFRNQKDTKSRPDGLIAMRVGKREWTALVESKVGTMELREEQVERYRDLANSNKIDCVITISNQFCTNPSSHPIKSVRKRRSSVPVFHWSWMHLLTVTDLILNNSGVQDIDQADLLNELRRFLSHESAGVKGFDRMPSEWGDLNSQIAAGAKITAKSEIPQIVLEAWHQETKDLSLILSRQTETKVLQKLPKVHLNSPSKRLKDELGLLLKTDQLNCSFDLADAVAPLEVTADIKRRTFDVGMTLKAPEDRVSSSARVNWLMKQIKTDAVSDLYVKMNWPGKSPSTTYRFEQLQENVKIVEEGKQGLKLRSFHIYFSKRTGSRFTQLGNFITDLEEIVPGFYAEIGQHLIAWKRRAPKVKDDKRSASEVSVKAISEDANEDAL